MGFSVPSGCDQAVRHPLMVLIILALGRQQSQQLTGAAIVTVTTTSFGGELPCQLMIIESLPQLAKLGRPSCLFNVMTLSLQQAYWQDCSMRDC